jgi:xanthine dehydrogenase accessory factor
LASLADGETMLLRVLPDSDEAFPVSPGAQVVTNPCLSGGAMEMFLEPLLPPPLIGVLGDTPIANALRVMAGSLGFEVGLLEDVGQAVAVIVSSHGRDEQEPIRAAVDAGVGFVGLVASRRRGQAVLSELRLSDAERARVHTPVGLWIGAKTADEIALSIMAEVVKAIRLDGLTAPGSAPAVTGGSGAGPEPVTEAVVTAVDPICAMTVTVGPDTPHLHLDGTDHWFCCAGCRDRFAAGAA